MHNRLSILNRQRKVNIFSPKDIRGMVLWLDPSRHIAADGDTVTSMANWGGTATITAASTKEPLYKIDIRSGRSVLSWPTKDSNDQLVTGAFTMGTAFVAAHYIQNTASNWPGLFTGFGTGYIPINFSSSTSYWYNGFESGTTQWVNGTLNVGNSTNALGNVWRVYSCTDTRLNSTTWSIGQDRTFTNRSWYGYIGDVICYNRVLNQFEMKKIERYLGKKYAITVA